MSKAALEQKAYQVVPQYMVQQNRPYSAIDVFTNLRQEFGKTLVVKALEGGVASGVLKEKVIGKQKIFYANQEQIEKFDEAVLNGYDEKILSISTLLDKVTSEHRDVQNELKELGVSETTPQLRAALIDLEMKVSDMEKRVSFLETARSSSNECEGKAVMENEAKMLVVFRKRKRMACDMINAVREGCPLPKKQLFESMGLEVENGEL